MATNHIHHGDIPTTCEEHLIDAHGLDIDPMVAVAVHDALHGDAQVNMARLAREIEVAHQALDMLEPYPPKQIEDEEGGVAVFTLAGRIERFRELLAEAAWKKRQADAEAIFARLQQTGVIRGKGEEHGSGNA